MNRLLSVVCPVFEEEQGLAAFHAELGSVLAGLEGWDAEILYVVDPGRDKTEEVLERIAASDPRVMALVLSRRFGHQASLRAGLEAARGDAVVTMDCDLQHLPSLIPEMLARFAGGAEVVLTLRTYGPEISAGKRLPSALFHRLLQSLSDFPHAEGVSEFRLTSRRVNDILVRQMPERGLYLRGMVSWLGFRSDSVPYVAAERGAGTTKFSFARLLDLAAAALVAGGKRPLRLAFFCALGCAVVTVGLWMLAALFLVLGGFRAALPLGLTGLLAGIAAAGFGVAGILGEYLHAVLVEVRQRPFYLVARRIGGSPANP
jgi:glycosyltransferase involved in cell wall biosynthesis